MVKKINACIIISGNGSNLNQIINISEKEIISNYVNIGAYIFKDVNLFLKSYDEISKINDISVIYVSHVIFKCIIKNNIFYSIKEFLSVFVI